MTTPQTVHAFLADPAFVNRASAFRTASPGGGVGRLAAASLSYFVTPFEIADTRTTRTPAPAFSSPTRPALLLDTQFAGPFVTLLQSAPAAQKDALFAILDHLVYAHNPSTPLAELELRLTTIAAYGVYVPQSLRLATTRASAPLYFPDGTESEISCPDWVEFSIELVVGGVASVVPLRVWANDAAFAAGYPYSTVTAIAPPLALNQVLTAPLTGTGANTFGVALAAAGVNQSALQEPIRLQDASGYLTYTVTLVDGLGAKVPAPFNVLYKGAAPDRMALRNAVRAYVLGSGVGSNLLWRARAPGLFVDARIYLIPQWNNRTTRSDQIIHPGAQPLPNLLENTHQALPGLDRAWIEETGEVVWCAYDTLTLLAVPHPTNPVEKRSFRALHPTYTPHVQTDPNFAYMADITKEMALMLLRAAAVAAGKASDPTLPIVQDAGAGFVAFDVDGTEFCVMSQESFLNRAGATL